MDLKQARRIALYSQGLLQKEPFGRGLHAVQRTIDQLHYIQIDTISVVDRAHHHVLNTRIRNYSPSMLNELQSSRQTVFEYWFHAAAYLPMADYRYYRPIMQGMRKKHNVDKNIRQTIIRRINTEGPLQSRDFAAPKGKKHKGWWDWKPTKFALEIMFLSGELMIRERQGFQKVYDLTENVLPDHIDISKPTDKERGHFYVRRLLTSLGIAQAKDLCYARATIKRFSGYDMQARINQSLQEMIESAEVSCVDIDGNIYYCLSKVLEKPPQKSSRKRISFLSPFDNLVINRRRLLELFDFSYKLECYVPEAKRKFGYFTLPILFGDALIGRLDCKAVRKTKTLVINNLWLEKKTKVDDSLIMALLAALNQYKSDLQCEFIAVNRVENRILKQQLLREL